MILNTSSPPSNELLMAIDESSTIITTANRSSHTSTPKVSGAKRRCRIFRSVRAFMTMVVDDIDSMAPRNNELINEKSIKRPSPSPTSSIPTTQLVAVIIAEPPTLSNFLKLNSRPSEKSNTTMPICAQKSILASSVTDGTYRKCGPTRKPATIYPRTSG